MDDEENSTRRHEVDGGSIDADAAGFAVARQGDFVPSAIVDATRCGFNFDGARTQIQVQKNVAAHQFHGEVVTLTSVRYRR